MAGEDRSAGGVAQGVAGVVAAASARGGAGFTLAEAEARGLLSADLRARRLSLLRGAVPEAFGEGGVDWELLRRLVEGAGDSETKAGEVVTKGQDKEEARAREQGEQGEQAAEEQGEQGEQGEQAAGEDEEQGEAEEEDDEDEEDDEIAYQPFGLFWAGMREAEQEVVRRTTQCLRPQRGESVNWAGTQNVFIEGENLAVLKLLGKAYWGEVKMIYIDPPYNTGKDFVYSDKWAQREAEYLRESGQTDEAGKAYSTNKESDGRFHSNWLSMMYPRLVLARELLREDGVIFISINDNEVHHLRMLCDKIFGDENFIAKLIWKNKSGGASDSKNFATDQEYILVYAKDKEFFSMLMDPLAEVSTLYNRKDERGEYSLDRLDKQSIRYSKSLDYEIKDPEGNSYFPQQKDSNNPNASWRWGKKTVKDRYDELVFKNEHVYTKNYKKDASIPRTLLVDKRFGRTRTGKTEFYELFKNEIFSHPKPTKLIMHLLRIVTEKNDIVMDFFAGSGTTADAVMQLNAEDGGRRRFVMAQLPEETPTDSEARKAGYKTIADIGRERIRRAALKIKSEPTTKSLSETKPLDHDMDLGFRSFLLDSSNFKIWEHRLDKIPDLQKALDEHVDRRIAGRKEQDFLYEILLKYGYLLTDPIEQKSIAQHDCHLIGEEGRLLFCLEDSVTDALLDAIEDMRQAPRHIVMFDHAFEGRTSLRANFYYVMKNKAHETQQDISVTTL